MINQNTPNQNGYTLIELLLYIVILGSLLGSLGLYFVTTTTARVKNQSIAEVDRQGALAIEYITQTIRNANSITSPAVGASADSLTLAVPTGLLSPTVFSTDGSAGGGGSSALGYNSDGGSTDSSNANSINATKFVASVSGTVTTLHAKVGPVDASPNNKAQMAIYQGAASPSVLLASSTAALLSANAWNTFTIPQVTITAGETYWLAYNTNSTNINDNNLRYHAGTTGQSLYTAVAYGSWPASWTGSSQNVEFSMYADVTTSGTAGALQVKEGVASAIPLTNSKVIVSNLTFKNLSRAGTPGVIQASFTIYRVNANNRNEYDYQKTFTASAALRP